MIEKKPQKGSKKMNVLKLEQHGDVWHNTLSLKMDALSVCVVALAVHAFLE